MLIKNGRQIDAVNLAFAFELTHQFSPISLLKSYLSETRKVPSTAKPGNTSPAASTQVLSLLNLVNLTFSLQCFLAANLFLNIMNITFA